MKVLFIYSENSKADIEIMNKAKEQMGNYITIVEIGAASPELRQVIRATPAIIPIVDDLQGEYIKGEGVDGQLIAVAAMYKWLEQEENVVHNQVTNRLDNFVKVREKQAKAPLELQLSDIGKKLVAEKIKNAKGV